MHDLTLDQVTASAAVVMVLQWLKQSKWFPWISAERDKLNRFIAAILAAFTAAGIHWNYDTDTHTLMIADLTISTVAHGVWDWLKSFAVQEVIYKGAIKPNGAQKP